MFDWLTHTVSGQPLTYLVVFGAAGGDVLFPLIPSETIIITASVVASQGHLVVWLIAAAAALGAFLGDNASYWLGHWIGERAARYLFRGEKGEARLRWAERQIAERGGLLIVVGRFIPGGRTATTFAAGTMGLPWRRFAAFDAVGATGWACYATALGYLGGSAFSSSAWKSLAASLGAAAMIALGIEIARRIKGRKDSKHPGEDEREQLRPHVSPEHRVDA